jgi:hypothetical protein
VLVSSLLTPGTSNDSPDLLEMTIVSADGEHRVLNPYADPEYFWAVRGGGGSSWGVRVSWSMIFKASNT